MRVLVGLITVVLLSGCSLVGAPGSPIQMKQAEAVHMFVSSIGPYGQRVEAANAVYQPRMYGLNPYFGR